MKPLLLSKSDNLGGAARATLRLHKAFKENKINSSLYVDIKKTDLKSVLVKTSNASKLLARLKPIFGQLILLLQKNNDSCYRSINYLNSGLVNFLNESDYDLLNIHWINSEFLSVEDLGKLNKPLILTLHDMWAFCGAEHYADEGLSARWRNGYLPKNRPLEQSGFDIDKWVWQRKVKAWSKPMHIVTPSRWLAKCVKESALMHNWPVTVIPNPINTEVYKPWIKSDARKILNFPENVKIILFGALGGGADPRKGWSLLENSLKLLAKKMGGIECVVFGQSEPNNPPVLDLNIHWMGQVYDDVTLALLYSAADVMMVPSIQENLPQAATEAQSCGCPVVAFNCTGLPDVVEHKVTGYLAKAYDHEDLAFGIEWVLHEVENNSNLSKRSRENAEKKYSYKVVAGMYKTLYEKVLHESA